jgi:hypothetical protein
MSTYRDHQAAEDAAMEDQYDQALYDLHNGGFAGDTIRVGRFPLVESIAARRAGRERWLAMNPGERDAWIEHVASD